METHPVLRDRAASQARAGDGPVTTRPPRGLHRRPRNTARQRVICDGRGTLQMRSCSVPPIPGGYDGGGTWGDKCVWGALASFASLRGVSRIRLGGGEPSLLLTLRRFSNEPWRIALSVQRDRIHFCALDYHPAWMGICISRRRALLFAARHQTGTNECNLKRLHAQ